jgi:predicted HD superfamily hydrolase involved in NAD metabolism
MAGSDRKIRRRKLDLQHTFINKYIQYLEKVVTPHRLTHSLGVMQVMQELTPIYGLDEKRAVLAGLLHDAAKDLPQQKQIELIAEAGLPTEEPWEKDYLYLHGPLGAYLVEKELGIKDQAILNAISVHTYWDTGNGICSPLGWCLRFADILEPNRQWDQRAHIIQVDSVQLRVLVYDGKLKEAALFQMEMVVRFFEKVGTPVHPNMRCTLAN